MCCRSECVEKIKLMEKLEHLRQEVHSFASHDEFKAKTQNGGSEKFIAHARQWRHQGEVLNKFNGEIKSQYKDGFIPVAQADLDALVAVEKLAREAYQQGVELIKFPGFDDTLTNLKSSSREDWEKARDDAKQNGPPLFNAFEDAKEKVFPSQSGSSGSSGFGGFFSNLFGGGIANLDGAEKDLKDGNPQLALEKAQEILANDPNNSDALSLAAAANAALKNNDAALANAHSALAINPDDKQAQAVVGLVGDNVKGGSPRSLADAAAFGSGSQGGSVPAGRGVTLSGAAGAASPGSASPAQSTDLKGEARRAMVIGDYQAALAKLDRAIAQNPLDSQAFCFRAMAKTHLGDYEGALKDINKALKLAPGNVAALDVKANILNRQKNYKDALAAANAALEANPKDAVAYFNRANALAGMGDRKGMLEALRKAAEFDPRNYRSTYADALQSPEVGDLMYLFPDERAPKAAAPAAAGPRHGPRFRIFVLLGAFAALALALAFVQFLLPPLRERLKARGASPLPAPEPLVPPARLPETLSGQYKLGRQIGAGGMGVVYEGTDLSLNRPVAVKKMHEELRLDRRERERFVTEAKTVAALHHPHIVDIYAIIEEKEEVYLIFEYVAGKTVEELIERKGSLGFSESMAVMRAAVSALDFAHGRGVIHRDLKPSNLMVNEQGCVKVMDFGIAHLAKESVSRVSMTKTVVGTPRYMAPEQEQGVVRRESDVYALAACFYEMLCGRMPFEGVGAGILMNKINKAYVPVSRFVSGLPEGIDEVFSKAFEPDPEARFHTVKEFLGALEGLAAASQAR